VKEVFVFYVRLTDISPAIWRRFELRAEGTFWHLHCAIQDAMGWLDCHLHEFRFPTGDKEMRIGIRSPEIDEVEDEDTLLAGWETPLKDWFASTPTSCRYIYDFGDGWEHQVLLESRRPAVPGDRLPRCLAGERACPPEDVGGPAGYEDFLVAVLDPSHTRHREYVEWVGGPFDPECFRPEKVRFSRPSVRLRQSGVWGM
jgi:hypothetical protein